VKGWFFNGEDRVNSTSGERVKAWAKARPGEVNGFLSAETGIELNAVALAEWPCRRISSRRSIPWRVERLESFRGAR
jgi:hypothetical protein